jgi:hypothetical protein
MYYHVTWMYKGLLHNYYVTIAFVFKVNYEATLV